MKTFIPLNDRLLVKPDKTPQKVGAIHLPDSNKKPTTGIVKATPMKEIELEPYEGHRHFKEVSALTVNKGEQVFFSQFAGTPIAIDGEDLIILETKDLLGVIR